MRFAVAALALFLALPAQAGGIGLLATGGAHSEKLYYHTDHTYGADGAVALDNQRDYPKYEMSQFLPHFGGGFELVLGDRDDRFLGTFRGYYLMDSPQADPAQVTNEPKVQSKHVVAAYRDTPRHLGMGLVGLSWGFVDIGDSVRFGVTAHVGSGFLTNDHTEFLAIDAGPMITWRTGKTTMVFADLPWQFRWRKGSSHSVNAFAGIRYMFD